MRATAAVLRLESVASASTPLVPAKAGTQCWIPACAGMNGLLNVRTQFHFSNSQIKQPSVITRILCGAGYAVVPSSSSLKNMRGWRAKWRNHCSFVPRSLSRTRSASRRATQTSLRCPGLFAASSFLRRAALCGGRPELLSAGFASFRGLSGRAAGRPQRPPSAKLLAGSPSVAAGRSPGAARVRALRGTPAGAASCSITKTPLDDALKRAERNRNIII